MQHLPQSEQFPNKCLPLSIKTHIVGRYTHRTRTHNTRGADRHVWSEHIKPLNIPS